MEEAILQEGVELSGRYRVGRLLGKGGMGAVYEGSHAELGRPVAIKVLLPKYAQDAEVLARFFREARAAAAIRHPGIVEILDLGRHEGLAFIVMEKLDGEELAERIRYAGRLGPNLTAHIGAQLADAIAAAHESGVVHRDLKPQNVFIARQAGGREAVKVLDFGIAKLVDADSTHTPLTRTGEVFGTPMYMAPEQLRAVKDVDARADIYAIGVILREALTGAAPYEAASLPDLMVKIVSEPPVPLAVLRPGLPSDLVAIVERAMRKDREDRFPTARELAQQLAAVAAALPPDTDDAPVAQRPLTRAPGETNLSDALDKTTPSPRAGLAPLASLPQATNPPLPVAHATGPQPPAPRSRAPWVVAGVAAVAVTGVVWGLSAAMRTGAVTTPLHDAGPPVALAVPPVAPGPPPLSLDAGASPVAPAEVPTAATDAGVAVAQAPLPPKVDPPAVPPTRRKKPGPRTPVPDEAPPPELLKR